MINHLIPLRLLPDGVRFRLIRTDEKFRLIERISKYGCIQIICLRSDGTQVILNHQCIIEPIVKPRIKLKVRNG